MHEQHLCKSPAIEVYGQMRITVTLTEGALLSFLQSGVEKLLAQIGDWTHSLRS